MQDRVESIKKTNKTNKTKRRIKEEMVTWRESPFKRDERTRTVGLVCKNEGCGDHLPEENRRNTIKGKADVWLG